MFCLWLIWQNVDTRQRFHIGNLIRQNGEYVFYYEHDRYHSFSHAVEFGYKPHLAFPDPFKRYTSDELFGAFARRLPDKRRPDYEKIVKDLGLPPDATDMDLLKATGGRLATDSYEFVNPIFVQGDVFNLEFYVAGWRYYDGDKAAKELKEGSEVVLKPEKGNKYDPFAIRVYSRNGFWLGYVPVFYSEFMRDVISRGIQYRAFITDFTPNFKPQLRTKVNIDGELKKREKIKYLALSTW